MLGKNIFIDYLINFLSDHENIKSIKLLRNHNLTLR